MVVHRRIITIIIRLIIRCCWCCVLFIIPSSVFSLTAIGKRGFHFGFPSPASLSGSSALLLPSSSLSHQHRNFLHPRGSNTNNDMAAAAASSSRSATTRSHATAGGSGADGGGGDLFLFDFDGVVCDSCDECTVSALRTCHRLGVLPNDDYDTYPSKELFDTMRSIRPAIEVGWQIPVLLSIVLEQMPLMKNNKIDKDSIISNYQQLVDSWLQKYKITEKDMVTAFGSVRDDWIEQDLPSWLRINTFYPGIPEALSNCRGKSILVTTKQHRFAVALCRAAGVADKALPDDDIYGLGMYKKKSDVIFDQMTTTSTTTAAEGSTAAVYAPENVRFFEDRWPTLVKCLKDDRLKGVRFYLCSWGYVTEQELAAARAEPRVEVIGLKEFADIVT